MSRTLSVAAAFSALVAGSYLLPACSPTADPIAPVPRAAAGSRIEFAAGRYPTLSLPNGDTRAVRSILRVGGRMQYGDYLWNEEHVPAGRVWVRIDLATQMISVFRADREIGTAVVLYGTDDKPTPTGAFPILERTEHHRSTLYDAEMPYMLRLTRDGVAIHASTVREGSATHGCIGVPPDFARRLFGAVKRGDLVVILPATPAPRTA